MTLQEQIQGFLSRGEYAAARPLLERAARTSTDPQLFLALARVLFLLGEKAAAAYQGSRAVAASHNSGAEAQVRIVAGELIQECGAFKDAERVFRDGVARFPGMGAMRSGLINTLRGGGRVGEAGDEALKALAQFPGDVLLHLIGAGALGESFRATQARDALLRAVRMMPDDARALVPAATMLNYCDGIDPAAVAEVHRRAGAALARTVGPEWSAPGGRAANERLRVALVSCDFRDHAVARFLEPWLAHRDRDAFEYVGVSLLGPEDETTRRLRALFDRWIDASGKPDDEIASLVRAANADIAVDLSGLHVTARPGVFARRVAPVQATYLGYANTTGIPAMDFRIVDSITDPPGTEALSTERLVRVGEGEGCFVCFSPDPRTPEIASNAEPGAVTFCSFNSQQKITDATLDHWAGVLRAVPRARLLLKARALTDARTREILNAAFAARSVEASRIEVAPHAADHVSHLSTYNRADIALDTFPYNGTTTTCEALCMGVPVVTLTGNSHASRVGASLLAAAGMGKWVARSPEEFMGIAARLAEEIRTIDGAARKERKKRFRAAFAGSALCDGRRFAKRFETALQSMKK